MSYILNSYIVKIFTVYKNKSTNENYFHSNTNSKAKKLLNMTKREFFFFTLFWKIKFRTEKRILYASEIGIEFINIYIKYSAAAMVTTKREVKMFEKVQHHAQYKALRLNPRVWWLKTRKKVRHVCDRKSTIIQKHIMQV